MTEEIKEKDDGYNDNDDDVDCSKALEAFGGDSGYARFIVLIASVVTAPLGYSSF